MTTGISAETAAGLAVLSQFTISTDQDDGVIWLEHANGECDWRGWPGDASLSTVTEYASAHAEVCDGKPQPRRPARTSPPSSFTSLWNGPIKAALGRPAWTPRQA